VKTAFLHDEKEIYLQREGIDYNEVFSPLWSTCLFKFCWHWWHNISWSLI